VLRYYEDRTDAEIADVLGFAAGTVRAVTSPARWTHCARPGPPRAHGRAPVVVAAAAMVVVAAVVAVVVPQVLHRDGPTASAPAAASDQNVLLAGLDNYGNADSIVLAHVGRGGATAVLLPRDA
jgi:hypothetical protein